MLLAPRIHQYELSELCHRLAVSLESGIELRRVFARESNGRSSTRLRNQLEVISRAVARGSSLHDAIAETGTFFPPFFRAMVEVGEQTGHSAEIFRHLSEHYARQLQLRRMFVQSITMPIIQLSAALGIIGLMIWLMGFIGVDVLGFGLMGTPGLLKYLGFLAAIGLVLAIIAEATRRGMLWTRPIEYGVLKVPALGVALQTLALSRLAWSLQLTYGVGMDLQRGAGYEPALDAEPLLHGPLRGRGPIIAARAGDQPGVGLDQQPFPTTFSTRWKWARRVGDCPRRWPRSRTNTRIEPSGRAT